MGTIITFYSYKGGVGRSMALANIAYELSRKGKKVLVVDWDLEAPGIERYFKSYVDEIKTEGLLQLLISFKNNPYTDYENFVSSIDVSHPYPISLLNSGREVDPFLYSSLLQNFNWNQFFSEDKGGRYLEELREQWKNNYDFILIDSRTGLSDSSGICTILMPDILIPMFTANYQSLFGIRDTVHYIQNARQKLNVDRMQLTVLPIPSRFGTRVEFKESQEWLDRIADILKGCYSDWLPKWLEPKDILERIKIPQIDYFSFGEKLAVVEHGTNDPEGMGYVFSKIANLLINDFEDISDFIGNNYYLEKKEKYKSEEKSNKTDYNNDKYKYDVYLSYNRDDYQWVRELLMPALSEYLNDALGRNPQIYLDIENISAGASLIESLDNSLQESKTLVYITNSTVQSNFQKFEIIPFIKRENIINTNLIFPILYNGDNYKTFATENLSNELNRRYYFDFSDFKYENTIKSTKLRSLFGQEIEKLATEIAKSIEKIQPRKKDFKTEKRIFEIDETFGEQLMLAKEYEEIRKSMKSSNERTFAMEKIVTRMKATMKDSDSNLEYWKHSESPGERLLAITKLQVFPNFSHLSWLVEHVGDIEKPFIGYQSCIAIYIATRTFGKEKANELEKILKQALSNINKYEYKDPNQLSVISSTLNELQNLK